MHGGRLFPHNNLNYHLMSYAKIFFLLSFMKEKTTWSPNPKEVDENCGCKVWKKVFQTIETIPFGDIDLK